jgi:hypothetical protein
MGPLRSTLRTFDQVLNQVAQGCLVRGPAVVSAQIAEPCHLPGRIALQHGPEDQVQQGGRQAQDLLGYALRDPDPVVRVEVVALEDDETAADILGSLLGVGAGHAAEARYQQQPRMARRFLQLAAAGAQELGDSVHTAHLAQDLEPLRGLDAAGQGRNRFGELRLLQVGEQLCAELLAARRRRLLPGRVPRRLEHLPEGPPAAFLDGRVEMVDHSRPTDVSGFRPVSGVRAGQERLDLVLGGVSVE